MLYLIENENLYKIGYTANLKTRMSTYKTHNPECVLINTIEGSSNDEKQLHKLCEEYRYSKEWFYKNDDILELFNNYKTIEWNNWDEIKISIDNFIDYVKQKIMFFQTTDWRPEMKYELHSKLSTFFKNVETLTKVNDYDEYYKKWQFVKNFYFNKMNKLEFITILSLNDIVDNSKISELMSYYFEEFELNYKKQVNQCNITISEAQNTIYKAEAEKLDLEGNYKEMCKMYDNYKILQSINNQTLEE